MMEKFATKSRCTGFLLLFLIIVWGSPVAPQSDYTPIKVENGGTITGTVKWTGPLPKIPKLPITKNADVCDPDSHKTRDLERLEVASDGGLANTVVYLKDVSRGKAMDLPEERQRMDQRNCRYIPHIMLVPQNASLQIKSSDPILHTVHMMGAASNNVPFPLQNQFIPVVMHRDGLVEIKCNAGHVWMNGEILVVKHPYYAVTDEHGYFKLTDVPPGEYEIVAWHEGWRILSEEKVLDVAAQVEVSRPIYSAPETWAQKVSVKPGQTTTADFSISAK
jgi:hypothetical protein